MFTAYTRNPTDQKPIRLASANYGNRVIAVDADNQPILKTNAQFVHPDMAIEYAERLLKRYPSAQLELRNDVYVPVWGDTIPAQVNWVRVVVDGWYPADAVEEGRRAR